MTTRARRRKKTSHTARPEPLTRRELPAERDPPTRSRYLPLLVVVAAVAAYANSLTVPFVFDDVSIPETPELHSLWPPSALIGTTRPLVQLSLALNYAAGGLVVIGYHLVNLAIHVAAALTLFGLVALTLRTARLRARWAGHASRLALAASGLWAVHPLQTESVTYVVQRSESLMALCYLLTLYCAARSAAAERPRLWELAAVVACALGMLSKPVMVTAPITVLLYDRVFLADSWSRAWRERRALYLGLAATWGILFGLLTAPHESGTTAGFAMRDLTWLEYASSQPAVVLHYLRLAVWPQGLVLDYAWPVAHGFAATVPPLLVLIGLMVATGVLFRREPSAGFLGAAFFLILAPSSSVIPIKDLAFEHRMYLPLAPLAVLAVVSAQILIERVAPGAQRQRRVETGLALATVIALTITTAARNRDYRSTTSIWADVVAKRPANPRARNNLGDALFEDGRIADSIVQLREALRLDPSYADAHNDLGRALAAQGDTEEAYAHYERALRLQPDSAPTHNNMGVLLIAREQNSEAEAHGRAAIRLKPDYAEAHNTLGIALEHQGKYEAAAAEYARALQIKPDYAEAFSNLGATLLRSGKPAEAEPQLAHALRINPERAEVRYNLALALAAQGKQEQAATEIAEALRLRPDLEPVFRKSGLLDGR